MYTSFMEAGAVEFESEAKRFLEDGYYNSVVGDTMPLALATALHAYSQLTLKTHSCMSHQIQCQMWEHSF